MGLWADTFGGGNSFTESVANTFTGGDGATYVGGTLTDDKTGQAVAQNESDGGFGTVDDQGVSQYSGGGNTTTTNANIGTGGVVENFVVKGTAPEKMGLGDLALAIVDPITALPAVFGAFAGWVNGIDPAVDDSLNVDGQMVYTKEGGMSYSYNRLGMPYEVNVVDNKVVDKLSQMHNENGELDPNGTITGYQYHNNQNSNSGGGDDNNNQIAQYQADNAVASTASGVTEISEDSGAITPEKIAEWATSVGMDLTEQDQKDIVADPAAWLKSRDLVMADVVPEINADAEGTTIDATNENYTAGDASDLTAETSTAATTEEVSADGVVTYDTDTNESKLTSDTKVDAAVGTIDSDNLVDADDITIDIAAEAAGTGVLGNALNDFASQNISSIIDTSTVEGKLLAEKLGEGNYTDHKATILGQMKIISAEFADSNGEPRIPSWSQATLREVQKSIAFGGMTGTAATAAYANAIMEATLGVAKDEAAFFQTITIANLDNRQEAVINKAKILANFELGNLSAREAAAVQNAKAFIEMDLANLSNEQQAEIINKEAMVQALFEDTKAINANRLFTAETQNEINQFYDELNAQVAMKNAAELNAMRRFNAGEINDTAEFNADMDASFAKFHAEMQYNIDVSNAKWRQTVETANTKMAYEAASTDLKNRLDISTEAQNRLWDRTDAELDMIFKAYSEDADRDMQILKAQITAQASMPQEQQSNSVGDIIGTATDLIKLYKLATG